jgi:peptidoglycan/LPS O-acetylase OafA/YrhL
MLSLGGASYALYILHLPLGDGARTAMDALGYRITSPALFALAFAAGATLVALAVFRLIEEPARRTLRRRLSPHPRPPMRSDPLPAPGGFAAETGD